MYHEEQWIEGRLYWRGTPDGQWIQASYGMVSQKLLEALAQLNDTPRTEALRKGVFVPDDIYAGALAYILHVGANHTMRGEPHPQQWIVTGLLDAASVPSPLRQRDPDALKKRKQPCTCTGSCRGPEGLGEGWVCGLTLPQ